MKFKYKKSFKINNLAEEEFEVIFDDVKEFAHVKESVEQMHETSKKMAYSQVEEQKKKRYDKNNPCRFCESYDECFRLEKDNAQCEDYENEEPF